MVAVVTVTSHDLEARIKAKQSELPQKKLCLRQYQAEKFGMERVRCRYVGMKQEN